MMQLPYGFKRDGAAVVADEMQQKVIAIIRELRAAGMSRQCMTNALSYGVGPETATAIVGEVYQPSALSHLHSVGVRLSTACAEEDGFDVEQVFADAIAAECAEVVRLMESRGE